MELLLSLDDGAALIFAYEDGVDPFSSPIRCCYLVWEAEYYCMRIRDLCKNSKVANELPEKIERLRCEASAYQKLLMKRVEDNLGFSKVGLANILDMYYEDQYTNPCKQLISGFTADFSKLSKSKLSEKIFKNLDDISRKLRFHYNKWDFQLKLEKGNDDDCSVDGFCGGVGGSFVFA